MRKKKVCIISLTNLYLCPYISKYTSIIDLDYDIIYWDRHGVEEGNIGEKQIFPFKTEMKEEKNKFSKLIGYLKFRNYAINIIKKNNYDGIILLQTSIGVLLQAILKKKFKGKYIVDIRDYTMEYNPIFRTLVKNLVINSSNTVISSKGYENFLPKYDYVLVHNDVNINDSIIKRFENRQQKNQKIIISYIGLIRFHDQNKKMILKFKDDQRFILRFIGTDASRLKEFCNTNNVGNVELIDRFPPEKTIDYYYDTDIIYNLYGNNSPLLDFALSNKLYYAAKLKIPILVCPNTFMEEVVQHYGFGHTFDLNDPNACDNLFNYYSTLDWNELRNNCNIFVDKVNKDNKLFEKMVGMFAEKI